MFPAPKTFSDSKEGFASSSEMRFLESLHSPLSLARLAAQIRSVEAEYPRTHESVYPPGTRIAVVRRNRRSLSVVAAVGQIGFQLEDSCVLSPSIIKGCHGTYGAEGLQYPVDALYHTSLGQSLNPVIRV